MIKGLHHSAYICRDSEETRKFYEDFLGLPLADAFEIEVTKSGRATKVLHSFYRMDDNSFLAFFEDPGRAHDFSDKHDFELHIALEVDADTLHEMFRKGKDAGVDTRGIADHGFIQSIYFRDPNGYVIELTVKTEDRDNDSTQRSLQAKAQKALALWQSTKPKST